MVRIILCGCNGKMGQVISDLVKADDAAEIVAGIDLYTESKNGYPVYESLAVCEEEADVIIFNPPYFKTPNHLPTSCVRLNK